MIETWMKVANVARLTWTTVNNTGLSQKDLPPELMSFISTQRPNVEKLKQLERQWLSEADTMPVQRLQILIDEMWSGWARAKLCEALEKRS